MAQETTKLTARRGLLYQKRTVKAGDSFDANSDDVKRLTGGKSPLAKAAKQPAAKPPAAALPDDFPGFNHLTAAGITTLAKVREMDEDALIAIDGIGAATAAKILKAAK